MIDVGFIVPVNYLEMFASQSHYHLVLAHLVERNREYRNFYRKMSQRGDYITLDNSSYELGDDIYSPEILIELADAVGASEVMAPEHYGDGQKTKDKALTFLDKIKSKKGNELKVFVTIHGEDIDDLVDCYNWCVFSGANTVGISCRLCSDIELKCFGEFDPLHPRKTIEKQILFRYILLDRILPYYPICSRIDFHFLGLNHPLEILLATQIREFKVRSIDTSGPFMASVFNEPFTDVLYKKSGKRCDLELFEKDALSFDQINNVQKYIDYLKYIAGQEDVNQSLFR